MANEQSEYAEAYTSGQESVLKALIEKIDNLINCSIDRKSEKEMFSSEWSISEGKIQGLEEAKSVIKSSYERIKKIRSSFINE